MAFWIITGALTLAVVAILARASLRGRVEVQPAAAFDVQVYRDQMKEIDRDLARGVITEEEAERVRAEVGRRLLEADRKLQAETATAARAGTGNRAMAAVTSIALLAGTFGLYAWIGAPGYGDLPHAARVEASATARESRPSQAVAEAEVALRNDAAPAQDFDPSFLELMVQLRAAVAERPSDVQGLTLLARNEAALGNFVAGYEAQTRLIEVKGPEAATAEDFANLADMMVLAAGGYVSPEAETALNQALARDRENGPARYYSGLMFAQTGRPDLAFDIWRRLLEDGPQDAPWIVPIFGQIEGVAMRAGVQYQPPGVGPGPSAADIAAAQDMAPEDRMAMIEGMVRGLADRLATEGGPPDDWARLIGAYGVLGETERARAVWEDAQQAFRGLDDALDVIESAAVQAGVAE